MTVGCARSSFAPGNPQTSLSFGTVWLDSRHAAYCGDPVPPHHANDVRRADLVSLQTSLSHQFHAAHHSITLTHNFIPCRFFLPISMVICNDIRAYIFDGFTKLIAGYSVFIVLLYYCYIVLGYRIPLKGYQFTLPHWCVSVQKVGEMHVLNLMYGQPFNGTLYPIERLKVMSLTLLFIASLWQKPHRSQNAQ